MEESRLSGITGLGKLPWRWMWSEQKNSARRGFGLKVKSLERWKLQKESQWFHFMISCWTWQKLWSRQPGTSFLSEPLKLERQPPFLHFFTSDMFFGSCVNFQTGNIWMWKLDGLPPNGIVYRQRSGHLVSPLVSHWANLQLGYFGNTNESRIFRKLYDIVDNMTL